MVSLVGVQKIVLAQSCWVLLVLYEWYTLKQFLDYKCERISRQELQWARMCTYHSLRLVAY